MPFALTAQHHRSPPAVWPFFTPQSTTPLTASPARTNLTWCKAQCRPVHRAKLRQVLRRTKCSSTYFQRVHPASMHFTQQSSLQSPTEHTRSMASYGVNSSQTKFSLRGPTTVPMQLCHHPVAAVRACGCPLLRLFFPIYCRSGDSSCRSQ